MRVKTFPVVRIGVLQFCSVGVWFIVRFPGVPHTDTISQLTIIHDHKVTNQWTLSWYLLLKYMTFDGQTLALIAAIQLLIGLFTLRRLASTIQHEFPSSHHAITWLILSPIFGYLATTVNHDFLAGCGVILMFVLLYEVNFRESRTDRSILLASAVLSTFSYISIFALLCSLFFLKFGPRKMNLGLVAIFFASVFILNFSFPGLSPNDMTGISLASDIKCAVEDSSTEISPSQIKTLSLMAPFDFWKLNQGYTCASSNQVFSNLDMTGISDSELVALWVSLGKSNPGAFIKAHLIKAGVAIPPPLSNKPSEVFDLGALDINTRHNVEFLSMDRSVSVNNKLLGAFRDVADLLAFSINLITGWLSWAGLWLLYISFSIARRLRKLKIQITISKFLRVLCPILSSHFFVILTAPLSEARYLLPTILIGLCLLFSHLLEIKDKYFVRT